MPDLLFIVPARNIDTLHRTLSMLSFQKDKTFRVCVVDLTGSGAAQTVAAEFEHNLSLTTVSLEATGEPLWKQSLEAAPAAEWVCFPGRDVDLTAKSVGRMRKCIADHPSYDVFHWNLVEPNRKFGLKTRPEKLFLYYVNGEEVPLASFVFRTQALRDAFAADPDAAGMDLAVIFSAAKKTGIRTARWERVGYKEDTAATDPAQVEKDVRARLAFYRWSERFFGEDYPLGVGDRLDLFAGELARLYPSFTAEELKEDLNTFAVVSGPVRRLRAASALKSALKARQAAITTPKAEA